MFNRYIVMGLGALALGATMLFLDSGSKKVAAKVVEVGNRVCPVSQLNINMGAVIKTAHNGKVYNLCSEGCISTFSSAPAKYAQIADAEVGK